MTKTAISSLAIKVFEKSVDDYHVYDDINRPASNPYDKKDFEHLLYERIGLTLSSGIMKTL